jgi:DNA-directed RNA polymerase subunit RPC12/RpoP
MAECQIDVVRMKREFVIDQRYEGVRCKNC